MFFNSLTFLGVFLPITTLVLCVTPQKMRITLLLIASYIFCLLWSTESAIFLFLTTVADYLIGRAMMAGRLKKVLLILSLVMNIGLLAFFKYADFLHLPLLGLAVPLGISYVTFKKLSYIIDIYRNKRTAETRILPFFLYTSFFPTLVAGPIDRADSFLPQTDIVERPRWDEVISGIVRILWGCAKKMIVADQAALLVNAVYDTPGDQSWVSLILATYFFSIQMYADFSGYTDMAIGTAQVLGFRLPENFAMPYGALTVSDFWRRWHITLSSWFRDYVYIPLGGNRVALWRQCLNILITFLLSGLWHGAGWTFVIWGGLHGLYLMLSLLTRNLRTSIISFLRLTRYPRLHIMLQWCIVFHAVTAAWIFFRARSIDDALTIISGITRFATGAMMFNVYTMMLMVIAATMMFVGDKLLGSKSFLQKRPLWLQTGFCYALILLICVFGSFQQNPFIYAQF